MLRLFPTTIYSDTGQRTGAALVVERLVDSQHALYYRLEDGRIGRVTQEGHGCVIVEPSRLQGLRPTV
jgi:hypothetical protein